MSRRSAERVFAPGVLLLGKYKVLRVIGSGGMGAVLEAENLRTNRRVAVKVLTGAEGPRASAAEKRFVNEARAAAKLTHPNSVDVLDLEQDEAGTLFIVQEFLAGESLYERLQRDGRLPWREALELLLPVMSALAEAHRKGVVHRDVKPENIFLAEAAPGVLVPKIIDFGIARLAESDLRLTRDDRVMGTPYYMSPEQASGARDLDGQTDVWAVGVVLYEAITGALPFDGKDLSVVMRAIISEPFMPMRLRDPALPEALTAVIERALQRDRGARHATMQDFLDAAIASAGEMPVGLGRLRASKVSDAKDLPAGLKPRGGDEGPSSLVPHITDSAERRRRTGGLRVTASGLAALVSVLVLGFAGGSLVSLWTRPPRTIVAATGQPAAPALRCPPAPVAPPVAAPSPGVAAPSVVPATALPDATVAAPETPVRRGRARVRPPRRPRR